MRIIYPDFMLKQFCDECNQEVIGGSKFGEVAEIENWRVEVTITPTHSRVCRIDPASFHLCISCANRIMSTALRDRLRADPEVGFMPPGIMHKKPRIRENPCD